MIFLNVNTQQIRYFLELAKCLNFTRAVANLYVAQPTLSQQIAELEAQLGVTLFIRNSRSVSLTPAGEILYAAYPDFMARMEQVQQQMLITAAGFKGALNIGFLDAFMDITPSDVILTDSLSNLRAYLESGAGYTVLPATQSSFFSPATHFLPIPGEELESGALWDPNSTNPALLLFLDALEQYLDSSGQNNL